MHLIKKQEEDFVKYDGEWTGMVNGPEWWMDWDGEWSEMVNGAGWWMEREVRN